MGVGADERIRARLLAVENRGRVYDMVRDVPGIHLRGLSQALDLSVGSVEHHVRVLVKHGLLTARRQAQRRVFFCPDDVDARDQTTLAAMQNPAWQQILMDLEAEGARDASEVARALRLDPSTAAYHLRRMADEGLLNRTRLGREVVYLLAEPDRVRRVAGLGTPTLKSLVARARESDGDTRTPAPRIASATSR